MFGRFSVLDFFTENGTNFGEELQGQPLGSSNPGTGEGNTYNVSGRRDLHDDADAADGRARRLRAHEHRRRAVGHRRRTRAWTCSGCRARTARTSTKAARRSSTSTRYADLGTTDTFMPYYRSDDQYQAVVNVNWIKGRHNIRFGTDIYYQALNHTQPEISGGDSFGARGGFRFQAGPTQIQGGPERQPVQRVRLLPARRAEPGRPVEAGRAVHDAQLAVQPVRPRSVAGVVEDHDLVRHAMGVLPGAARARPAASSATTSNTNQMMIGGVGIGADGSRRQASARRCSRRASA